MRCFGVTALALLTLSTATSAVELDWATVRDPGNYGDIQIGQGWFGAVGYVYRISIFEITNSQYAEFLNAVAETDTNALYNTNMGWDFGGITRTGSSGGYDYTPIAGRENMPVNYVSFYDSLRFANWLHNGQPTGTQGVTTTEDGAYTITPGGITANSITRNVGATVFLTSEDEWYKAAYYDVVTATYSFIPTPTDVRMTCAAPGATVNAANCGSVVGDLTDVGSYTDTASPNGTFDQGGNVWEWNEVIDDSSRGLRGGDFGLFLLTLEASFQMHTSPTAEDSNIGFRVASIPEPSADVLGIAGVLILAGLSWRRA